MLDSQKLYEELAESPSEEVALVYATFGDGLYYPVDYYSYNKYAGIALKPGTVILKIGTGETGETRKGATTLSALLPNAAGDADVEVAVAVPIDSPEGEPAVPEPEESPIDFSLRTVLPSGLLGAEELMRVGFLRGRVRALTGVGDDVVNEMFGNFDDGEPFVTVPAAASDKVAVRVTRYKEKLDEDEDPTVTFADVRDRLRANKADGDVPF